MKINTMPWALNLAISLIGLTMLLVRVIILEDPPSFDAVTRVVATIGFAYLNLVMIMHQQSK